MASASSPLSSWWSRWRAPILAVTGLAGGFFDIALLESLGFRFERYGADADWMLALYFGISFAALCGLGAALMSARDRERQAKEQLHRQSLEIDAAQHRVAQSDKLAALGQLAAAVAHEVRNPLGVIRSAAQSVTESRTTEEAQRAAKFIVSEADRLNTVVGSVLAFAKPLQVQPQPAPLASIVDRAITLARHDSIAKGVQIHSPERLDEIVRADPDLLTQALLGLLHNAIEASAPGGVVGVAVRGDADAVCVEVHDSGPGVPDDLHARVFEPFFTTRTKGTGLGLAIVRQIVEAHRGSIAVSRATSGGACFTLRLPAAA